MLKGMKQTDITSLIEWLIETGHLKQVETTRFRPLIHISDSGLKVLSGKSNSSITDFMPNNLVGILSRRYKGKTPHRAPESHEPEPERVEADDSLTEEYEVGESEKTELQAELQMATSSDSQLALELVETIDEDNLAESNVVDAQVESDRRLQIGETNCDSEQPRELADGQHQELIRADLPHSGVVKPSFFWTWRLFADGYSAEQIQQVRHIDLGTIFDHATRAIEEQLPFELKWIFPDDQIAKLADFVGENSNESLLQMLAKCPEDISHESLVLFVKTLATTEESSINS
jgi:ATP-dependent DNA helicase RecQ